MAWVHNYPAGDPNDDINVIISIHVIFPVIAFLAVCLRFYARRYTGRAPWVDDYAALATSLLTLLRAAIVIVQTRWGLGLNLDHFPPQNAVPFSKIQYYNGPIYTLALLGFKVALLTSYLRIGGFITTYRSIILGTLITVIINQIVLTFIVIFRCIPVSKVWHPSTPGHCIHSLSFDYAIAGTSIAFDLIIILLPLPVFWKLSLRLTQKIILTCVFALGFFITAIQVVRIMSISNLKNHVDSKATIIWSTIELSLGVIICCIPTYAPFIKAFASSMSARKNRGGTSLSRLGRAHPSRFIANGSFYSGFNPIGGYVDTHNTTIISTNEQEQRHECVEDECGQNFVRTNPWHIHTTREFSVQERLA